MSHRLYWITRNSVTRALDSKFDTAQGHTRGPNEIATTAVIHVQSRMHTELTVKQQDTAKHAR